MFVISEHNLPSSMRLPAPDITAPSQCEAEGSRSITFSDPISCVSLEKIISPSAFPCQRLTLPQVPSQCDADGSRGITLAIPFQLNFRLSLEKTTSPTACDCQRLTSPQVPSQCEAERSRGITFSDPICSDPICRLPPRYCWTKNRLPTACACQRLPMSVT